MSGRARVVARFTNGRVLKGFTRNFDPGRPTFELFAPDIGRPRDVLTVRLRDLKTLFFVRDFRGRPAYRERKTFEGPFTGRRLSVQFADGETMVGTTFGYDEKRQGFFVFPADPASNNLKAFVVAAAVTRVALLPNGAVARGRAVNY
jgi:hypothetical protein